MWPLAVEDCLCVLLLLFFAMQGYIPGIAPNQAVEMSGAAATHWMQMAGMVSQALADSLMAALVLAHLRRVVRWAQSLRWVGLLAVFALLSALWSQDAALTLRRAVPLVLATLFALYFAVRFTVRRQVRLVWIALVLAALASVAVAVFFPAIGLEASRGHSGDWQGVFTQKNACGRAMVLATATLLAVKRWRLTHVLSLCLFVFVLIMSGSRGAWAIEAALVLFAAAMAAIRRFEPRVRTVLLFAGLGCVAAMAAAGLHFFPLLAGWMGRDGTLTGRTAIWQQVWVSIWKHPLLGYGYSAFWRGLKGESFQVIVALKFVLFHAHNGFLEIWLELGAAGLALFALSYLRAWRRVWPWLRGGKPGESAWLVLLLLLIGLYDLDENTLLTFNGLFWILYVSAVANIEFLHAGERLLNVLPATHAVPVPEAT